MAGAESSWRPPWFDSAMASTPASAAIIASATVWMPLTTIGPSQTERSHSTSRPREAGVELRVRCTRPATTAVDAVAHRARRRRWRSGSARCARTAHVQPGWMAPSSSVSSPIFGGSSKPRRTSRSRRPSTAVSTVSTSASNPAAAARVDHLLAQAAVAPHVDLEPLAAVADRRRPPRSTGCRASTACTAARPAPRRGRRPARPRGSAMRVKPVGASTSG